MSSVLNEDYAFDFIAQAGEHLMESVVIEFGSEVERSDFSVNSPSTKTNASISIETMFDTLGREVSEAVLVHSLGYDVESAVGADDFTLLEELSGNNELIEYVVESALMAYEFEYGF